MPTEHEWLQRDIAEVRQVMEGNQSTFSPLSDLTDLDRHNYVAVVTDLVWRIYYDVIAIELLLREKIPDTLLAVERTTLEALTTLSYLLSSVPFS